MPSHARVSLSTAKTEASPPGYLREMWDRAALLAEGDELEVAFHDRADAVRAQRWAFRERKRAKARLIEQYSAAGDPIDPDAADAWRGLVTFLRGASLVVARPRAPLSMTVKHASDAAKPKRARR